MKTFFNKIKVYVLAHKVISVVALVLIILVGNLGYQKLTSTTGETRYVLSPVTKGTIVSAVTGSGQVSASNQIDIKPKVSGTITYVGVQPGNQVGSGRLLFSLDSTDAQKAVRDAEVNLQSAQIALDKLKVQNSNVNLNAGLVKAYDDGFNTVSNTFLDLPGIMSGLNDMFYKSNIGNPGQLNVDWYAGQVAVDDYDAVQPYKQNFITAYNAAVSAYAKNSDNYKSVSRTSDNTAIENIISDTYNDVKLIASAIKNANNYIDFVNNSIQKNNNRTPPSIIATHKNILNTYTSQTNTHLVDLLSIENSIQANKDSFTNSDLDTKSQALSLQQKQNALQDAKDNLSYYSVYAPFSGTIASVPVQRGDTASSGTTLATIITTQQIATISLNEVDIAKIQLGQKATLTFDAVTDLTITGKVAQIDSIGTVSQGVVNYNVKISFDTTDPRIKPGMSVSAAVITGVKQDVLTVPNSAVKNQANGSYIEMFDVPLPPPLPGVQGSPSIALPRQQIVVTGVANDTSTEIVSGLNEGDEIVTRTILPSATTATAPSIFGSATNRGGSAVRIPTTTGR